MSKILLLIDYKKEYLISVENLRDYTSMSIDKICKLLESLGHSIEIEKYSELDQTRQYQGYYVLYQTSEDVGGFYKDYIEDIAYFLARQGAILLPGFSYLLAHHNKNFMEILRSNFSNEAYKTIKSKVYGTAEEAIQQINDFPVIIKSSEGSGSRFVLLARQKKDFVKKVKDISGVFLVNNFPSLIEFIIYRVCLGLFNRVQTRYRAYTFYRKKFIVQNYIEGLQGDYKVLVFGEKYFPVFRKNRENDFRASGSGIILPVEEREIPSLLDFVRGLAREIEFPIFGADVGFDGNKYHLFEFQCIHIGPYALQASQFWYEFKNGEWVKFYGKSDLEDVFCKTINEYIRGLEKQ